MSRASYQHRYELIRHRSGGSFILRDPREVVFLGSNVLTGIEVGREGDEIAPRGVDERRRVISIDLITRRTVLTWDLHYGRLVARPC